jgi:hypothetical protein
LGLAEIYAGRAAARYFGVPTSDPRHPDVWGVVQVGVVYTGGTKIAEHGGANPADRDVPIVVYAPGAVEPGMYNHPVETTQIAPTILDLLGLDPGALQAVQIEGTRVLPGIDRHQSDRTLAETGMLAGGERPRLRSKARVFRLRSVSRPEPASLSSHYLWIQA